MRTASSTRGCQAGHRARLVPLSGRLGPPYPVIRRPDERPGDPIAVARELAEGQA